MSVLPGGWRALRAIWRRAPERQVDAEVAFHLDERTAELVARGIPADAARAQALADFGDVAAVRSGLVAIDEQMAVKRSRAERLEWVAQDFRYVLRALRRSPAFVVTVSLTLALGLGANAAIFSLLDRLFLRTPSGIAHPELVHRIYRVDPASASKRIQRGGAPATGADVSSVFSHDDFAMLRRTLPAGAMLGGYTTNNQKKLGRGDEATMLTVQWVIADFFGALGIQPERGRFFQEEEQRIETPTAVLVIGDALWRGRFGGRSDIVGMQVDFNYRRFTIIGVAPPGFNGPDNDAADAWVPMNTMGSRRGGPRWYEGGHGAWIRLLARADAGSTPALEHAATVTFRQTTFRPDSEATGLVAPLVEAAMPGFDHKEVTIATRLAGVAAIILLIACANVANLFLARGMTRRRELAMRLALGVTRRRLVFLLLLEALVVSLLGAAVALVVATQGGTVLRGMLFPGVHWVGAAVDVRVLLFTTALALVTGVLAGLVPALRSSRPDLAVTLKGSPRDGVFQRSRVRAAFLISQSALSVLLLAGAGLFVRSLHSVETENIGYDADRVVFVEVAVDPDHADRASEIDRRLPALADRLRRLPGVEGTGLSAITPMHGFSWLTLFLPTGDSLPRVAVEGPFVSHVSPDFFQAVGIHVIQGRGLTSDDRPGDGLVMVVNETMARTYWPGRPAVGQCLVFDKPGGRCVPVVGVVTNAHFDGIIEKPSTQFYLPLADTGSGWRAGVIAVRVARGHAGEVATRIRQMMRPDFAGWAEPNVHAMSDDLAGDLRPWRIGAALFSAAGILALLVAIVGVYSTISYTFAQRTHEIGVRVALGARAGNVVRLVVSAGVRVVLIGAVLGVVLALAAARLVESMLYKTSAHDPAVLIAVPLLLLVVAAVACLVPAWRALRVDPATALRAD